MHNNATVQLEVTNLCKYYKAGKKKVLKAVDDISFVIYKGETLGIVGESGCGKTTSGKTCIGMLQPTSGQVKYQGKDVHHMTKKERFDFTGKVVLTARGNQVLFADKHQNAQAAGAAAALIYNNVSGALNASIEGSTATIPCGGLSMEDAQAIFALCQKNEAGLYTCTLKVTNGLHVNNGEDVKYPTMSDFSSWGTTDDLTIKPEITAPGGNI